jgi:hypothetical protein
VSANTTDSKAFVISGKASAMVSPALQLLVIRRNNGPGTEHQQEHNIIRFAPFLLIKHSISLMKNKMS